jgi:hypothetical protein
MITVEPKTLEAYVGAYRVNNDLIVTVTASGGKLFAQVAGEPKSQLLPTGTREFFLRDEAILVTFEAGPRGNIAQLTVDQRGAKMTARRVN